MSTLHWSSSTVSDNISSYHPVNVASIMQTQTADMPSGKYANLKAAICLQSNKADHPTLL